MPLIGSLVDDNSWQKNQWAWRYVSRNFPNGKQKKDGEKNSRILKNNYERCKVCVMGIPEGKRSSFSIWK